MQPAADVTGPIKVATLPKNAPFVFSLVVSPDILTRLSEALDLVELRKLSLRGQLTATSKSDWRLEATLGATAIQACVATHSPLLTRIDEKVERIYIADWRDYEPTAPEAEMPENDNVEPLGTEIDLERVVQEALALSLPAFPRSSDAPLVDVIAAPPGTEPLKNEEYKPFAALAGLKRKIEDEN